MNRFCNTYSIFKSFGLFVTLCLVFTDFLAQNETSTRLRLFNQTTELDSLNLDSVNTCYVDINQPSHGFTMFGATNNVPFIGYITPTGTVGQAKSDSVKNQGLGLVYVLDNNNLRYYVCDQLIEAIAHGYTVGDILNLQDDGTLDVDSGRILQPVYEVVSNDYLHYLKYPAECIPCYLNDLLKVNLVSYWDFDEGSGTTAFDKVNNYDLLAASNAGGTYNWDQVLPTDGVITNTAQIGFFTSAANSAIVGSAMQSTNELTIETCIRVSDPNQSGPARLVTYSRNTTNRNFTFGTQAGVYVFRLRTNDPGNTNNGLPNIILGAPVVPNVDEYLSITRDASGVINFYKNGVFVSTHNRPGNFSNWDLSHGLGILNEFTLNRQTNGQMNYLAIYNTALTADQIAENYRTNECNPVNTDCEKN